MPERAAMLLIDLERSVAPSHIPGKYQSFNNSWMIVPRSGSITASVRLGSEVIERAILDPNRGQSCDADVDMREDSEVAR